MNPTINKWLLGALQAAEGGAIGAFANAAIDPSLFTREGAKHLAISAGIGAVIAVRNWLKEAPRTPWTDQERLKAQKESA